MTTIKSHTDLSQSKKLAEFLPLESADMKWFFWKSEIDAPKLPTFGYSKTAAENYKNTEAVYLPCWSLATLLNVIPGGQVNKMADSDKWEASSWNNSDFEPEYYVENYDNPVDACVALIEKLYK